MIKKHLLAFLGITMAVAQVQQPPPSSRVMPSQPLTTLTPAQIVQKKQEVTTRNTQLKKQLDEDISKNPQLKKLEDEKTNLNKQIGTLQEEMALNAKKNEPILAQAPTNTATIPKDVQAIMQKVKINQRKLGELIAKRKSVDEAIKRAEPTRPVLLKKYQASTQELKEINLAQTMKPSADRPR